MGGVGSLRSPTPGERRPGHPTGIQPLLLFARALSVCLRYCLPDSGGTRLTQQFLPYPVCVILPGACCPCPDHASSLPFVRYCRGSSHRARSVGHGSCRGVAHVTANTGPRPTRRVLTRGHALRACPLFRPLPPTPPIPRALRAPFCGRKCGGKGAPVTANADDCFPEPLRSGAAVLIGDTPRRPGAWDGCQSLLVCLISGDRSPFRASPRPAQFPDLPPAPPTGSAGGEPISLSLPGASAPTRCNEPGLICDVSFVASGAISSALTNLCFPGTSGSVPSHV